MELYLDMLSQPCRAVFMFAKKNNLPVEVKMISLANGEQLTEEFGKINVLRKVPALKDGDFGLGESIPMMEYMAERFHTPDHWFPKDLQKRARVNEYLSWHHLGLRTHSRKLFWLKLMAPEVFKLEVPEDKMAAALEDLSSALDQLEKTFIRDGGFIGGREQISVADLVAIAEVMQPWVSGVDVFEGRPRLSAWRERVVWAVGRELFDEAHKALTSLKESIKVTDAAEMEAFRPRVLGLIG